MTGITAFIKRHPVLNYFALTFAISWGGVLLVIGGPSGIPATAAQSDRLFPAVYLAMLAGPSIAGLLLTALVDGRQGLREFRARLLTWRVALRWYTVALLGAPLAAIVVLLSLSVFSQDFVPQIFATDDPAVLLLFGLGVGLGAGFFEELGWTGFAVPHLRQRLGLRATGLFVGLVWAAWHVLVMLWGIGDAAGSMSPALFITVDLLSFLPVYRLLMVWVYDCTRSLLVAMLMHASLTATTLIFMPRATGASLLTYDLALAASLWLVIATAALGGRVRDLHQASAHS